MVAKHAVDVCIAFATKCVTLLHVAYVGLGSVLSRAVTEGVGYVKGNRRSGMKIDFIDVRRAYFHARAKRRVFIKLPAEDNQEGYCGELCKSSMQSSSKRQASLKARGVHVYFTMGRET